MSAVTFSKFEKKKKKSFEEGSIETFLFLSISLQLFQFFVKPRL